MDTLLETCPMAENNLRNLYEIYFELGHDVFEEKIKKPMEIICMIVPMILVYTL